MDIWGELGIEPTRESRRIRRAYAARLKHVHPEDDPEGFQALRQAYETALALIDEPVEPVRGVAETACRRRDGPAGEPHHDPDPVQALVARLFEDLGQGDETAAALRLAEALRDPALTNLERRAYLELQLLEEMAEWDQVPPALAAQAATSFNWYDDLGHLPPAYRVLARDLLSGPGAEQRLAELRAQARTWPRWLLFHKQPLAAALLLGPYRPWLFSLFAFSRGTFDAMSGLVQELRCSYPAQVWDNLDPRTVDWWKRRVDRPAGRLLATVRYLLSAYWIYGGLLLFARVKAFPDFPQLLLLPIIVLSVADLVSDLKPAIARAVALLDKTLQSLPMTVRRGLLPACALGLAAVAVTAGAPESQYAALAAFPFFAAMSGERDLLKFMLGAFALFWLGLGLVQLGLAPEPHKDLLFLFVQATLLAALKLWRLAEQPRAA
jgi:hypothetical protein